MTSGTPEPPALSFDGLDEIDFGPDGIIPVVTQDIRTREVLIPAFTNREMVRKTLETGDAWYWSRSRARPWRKGEESGNVIRVREVRRNCYDNSLLYLGEPAGPSCHTGAISCFYRRLDGSPVDRPDASAAGSIDWLWERIQQRLRDRPAGSYVVALSESGLDRIARKVGEEAAETIIAAKNQSPDELANEMADLWFHTLLLLADAGMTPADVFRVLAERHTTRPLPAVRA